MLRQVAQFMMLACYEQSEKHQNREGVNIIVVNMAWSQEQYHTGIESGNQNNMNTQFI